MSTALDETPQSPPTPPQSPPTRMSRLLHDIALERPLRDPVRRRRMLAGLGALVIACALVLGLLRVTGLVGAESQEERDRAAVAQVQQQILPQLQELMTQRDAFFAAERDYLAATGRVTAIARTASPDFAEPVRTLQRVSAELTRQRTQLREVPPEPGVTSEAHDYLLSAVTVLGRDAARNVAGLQRPRGRRGLVAVGAENALPSIRRMNKSLLYVLDAAQLPVRDFDLPGGTDRHKDDHSTAR